MIKENPLVLSSKLEDVQRAAALLREGSLVGIPTETVYGLAAHGENKSSIEQIYRVKNRPLTNPLILHYGSLEQLRRDVQWSETAQKLAEVFWPGPLTLILPRSKQCTIPAQATGGLPTLAVRIPQHPVLKTLFSFLNFPLAAPSANPSGRLSPTTATHVAKHIGQNIAAILDGGSCPLGVESTILDLTDQPRLLRPGGLMVEKIETILGKKLSPLIPSLQIQGSFTSPGLFKQHYAPRQPLRLEAQHVESEEGLLAFGPNPFPGAALTINLSERGNLEEAATRLFESLHLLQESPISQIAVMSIPDQGPGLTINDRLRRAAATASGARGC